MRTHQVPSSSKAKALKPCESSPIHVGQLVEIVGAVLSLVKTTYKLGRFLNAPERVND